MQQVGGDETRRDPGLSADRRALLERILAVGGAAHGGTSPIDRIQRRSSAEPAPLSYAQQRLWFLHQLAPLSAFYNIPFVTRLEGRVNAPALQRAFDEIVRRHEVLRTSSRRPTVRRFKSSRRSHTYLCGSSTSQRVRLRHAKRKRGAWRTETRPHRSIWQPDPSCGPCWCASPRRNSG